MLRIEQLTNRRLAWLCGIGLLLCLGAAGGQRAAVQSAIPRSAGVTGWQFAFADLDGDREPDMASVEIQNEQADSTNYTIRLQFARGTGSYIGVKGPFGGLRLAVRDVNGDDSLDLILTSTMDRQVLRVLLNDGHGNFLPAELGVALMGPEDSEEALRVNQPSVEDGKSSTPSRWSFDDGSFCSTVANVQARPALGIQEAGTRRSAAPRLCHGRAPPVVICHS
jgi:hypothetical protein